MQTLTSHAIILRTLLIALMLVPAAMAKSSTESSSQDASQGAKASQPINSVEAPATPLQVEVVDAPTLDKEPQEVLDALKKLLNALEHHDLETVAACLSDNVTQINEHRKVMYGKTEVMDNIKENIVGTHNENPVKRIKVYSPFIDVKGDTAMVSFRATKEMSGTHPTTLESWCSEVFERKDGKWLVLELETNWKPVHSKHQN